MNTNASEMRVEDVLVETGNYYLLGFTPRSDAAPGELRPIRVEANRRGVNVIARRGYYVPSREPAAAGSASVMARLQAALEGLLPQSTMRMSLNAFPVARSSASSIIGMAVGIEPALSPAARQVLAAVFDANGKEIGRVMVRVDSTPLGPEESSLAMDEVFLPLEVSRPGRYHVRAAVADPDTNRVASVYDMVEVPDFGRAPLSLSGLVVFAGAPTGRTVTAVGPFAQTPTTRRTFARGEQVAVSLQVVQQRDRPSVSIPVSVRVLDVEGERRFERTDALAPDAFDAAGQTMYTFVLPGSLAAGPYTLIVEAGQGRGRATRSAHFEIEP